MKTVENKEAMFVTEICREMVESEGMNFVELQRSYDELLDAHYFNVGEDNEIRIIKSGLVSDIMDDSPVEFLRGVAEKLNELSGSVKITENDISIVVNDLKNETEQEALIEILEAIGAFKKK